MRPFVLLLTALTLMAQGPAKNSFKVSGSPAARVQIELYTDFQCPHCREFYLDTLPSLIAQYVKTGKVRLVHRDFPLPSFQFSRLAARYANAAGELGKYDIVANQIFQTQPEWSQNGNVDAEVAKVLSPADMKKVREMAKNDPRLDDTVAADVAAGNKDNLNQTPTIVIVSKGKRDVIPGAVPFAVLKSYLDKKLSK